MDQWMGKTIYDNEGDKVGSVDDLYVDEDEATPTWVTVKTGFFGRNVSFIPIELLTEEEDNLVADTTKDHIKNSPNIDPESELSDEEQATLYRYYGMGSEGSEDRDTYTDDDDDTAGLNTREQTPDDAMTRSEEELQVDTATQERGRVRLRKYVTTENVSTTVPVQREKVRLEREPISGEDGFDDEDEPTISDEEREVTLNEEVPVVDKEVVPKERVRLDKETVTDEREVNEQVRKEHIGLEPDEDR